MMFSIMKITRLGHAATLVETTKTIIIDPFLTDNPAASLIVDELPKIDVILITHDHFDHFGDALAIAKRDKAPIVGVFELTTRKDIVDAGAQLFPWWFADAFLRRRTRLHQRLLVHHRPGQKL